MANEKKGLVDITTGAEVNDANANGILDLSTFTVTQLDNIGTASVSSTQWTYLGDLDQALTTTDSVTFGSVDVDLGTFQLPTGTTVNEISTTVDGSSTDDQLPTAKACYDAVAVENLWDRVTGTTNYLVPYVDSLDELGQPGAEINRGYFNFIHSTAMPIVGGTSINANGVLDLTSGEVSQLANIGATTISAGQWVYLGASNQGIATTDSISFASINVNSAYTFPTVDGSVNEVLKTNGSGVVTWQTDSTVTPWGSITGTLSNQTDLQTALDTKQDNAPVSVPTSDSDTGSQGEWSFGGGYLYICVATDTWIRTAVVTSF